MECLKCDLHILMNQAPGEAPNLLTLWVQGGKDAADWYPGVICVRKENTKLASPNRQIRLR